MNIETGNLDRLVAERPKGKGWVVGSFIPESSLLHSDACEVKWAKHPKGLKKTTGMDLSSEIRTLVILISGKWRTWMPGEQREVILSEPGDFLAYDTGEHESEALEDSHVVVVRWRVKTYVDMPWKKLSSELVYKSPWTELTVDELETETGKKLKWDFVHKKPFAIVIPWDGVHFTLVGLYRYPIDKFSWEFPAGFSEDGSVEEAAMRELREETGLLASGMENLGYFYVANGFTNQACHVFFATGLAAGEPEREDAEEDMQTKKVTLLELKELIRSNIITDGPTISAFALMMEMQKV